MGITNKNLRTWIEIDAKAARKNCEVFRKIIAPQTKLWAVVKSNAYGHGLAQFSRLVNGGVDGFCVDSAVEGVALRRAGIKKPILVLGPTLPVLFEEAARKKLTLTIANFEALKALSAFVAKKATHKTGAPNFHIKVDTGLHRQGFYVDDLPHVIRRIAKRESQRVKNNNHLRFAISSLLTGIYTHFASAKDLYYPTYTERQFAEFQKAAKLFERAGFDNLMEHCAATGGVFMNQKYHLDAVRIGIGLYGLWPSKELEIQIGHKIKLRPVLSWRAVIADVKNLKAGDYVGYDLSERVADTSKMAIIPIGYWHGFPGALSSIGEVIVNGRRAKVLGRVSMDLLTVDVSKTPCKPGDVVTILGKSRGEEICAADAAQRSGTSHYEFLTRLNPLVERVVV